MVVDLIQPGGIGVTGPGTNGYMRALLVELLTRQTPPSKVVMSRNELNRLFEGDIDDSLITAYADRLLITELLEDAIEHFEVVLCVSDDEQANHPSRDPSAMYWIATPGSDDDVVVPLVRGTRLNGVMFGEWQHGPTCVIDATGTTTDVHGSRATQTIGDTVARLTIGDALAQLRSQLPPTGGA